MIKYIEKKFIDSLLIDVNNYSEKDLKRIFNGVIVPKYIEHFRYYHNLEHIYNCLNALEDIEEIYKLKIKYSSFKDDFSLNTIILAIILHDIIYDPNIYDKEAASANFAKNLLEGLGLSYLNVLEMIIATKNNLSNNKDCKIVIDCSLARLAKPYNQFLTDEQNIRKEQYYYSDQEYKFRRIDFMKCMLNKEKIYFSSYGKELWEKNARINIEKWLQENK